MVNPGAFKGARRAFLMEQKPLYAEAVLSDHAANAIIEIQRRFFKRFPIDMADDEEPTKEALKAIDDGCADAEPDTPDEDVLSAEDFALAMAAFQKRKELIVYRRQQIKRWMSYQYRKDHKTQKEVSVDGPLATLVSKLTGISKTKPRLGVAHTTWGKHHRSEIDAEFEKVKKRRLVGKVDFLKVRAAITKELFEKLEEDIQQGWREQVELEHSEAMERWEAAWSGEPSKEPEDRQKCISGLVGFVQPILDMICDHTGMKATLIVGGPEPADGGRLNIYNVHSGVTQGTVGGTFGEVERKGYKDTVMPLYSAFLKKCYTVADCRAMALPPPGSLPQTEREPSLSASASCDPTAPDSSSSPSPPRDRPPYEEGSSGPHCSQAAVVLLPPAIRAASLSAVVQGASGPIVARAPSLPPASTQTPPPAPPPSTPAPPSTPVRPPLSPPHSPPLSPPFSPSQPSPPTSPVPFPLNASGPLPPSASAPLQRVTLPALPMRHPSSPTSLPPPPLDSPECPPSEDPLPFPPSQPLAQGAAAVPIPPLPSPLVSGKAQEKNKNKKKGKRTASGDAGARDAKRQRAADAPAAPSAMPSPPIVNPAASSKGKEGGGRGKRAAPGDAAVREAKRRKAVDAPDSAMPAWLRSSLGMLRSQDLGPEWVATVDLWERFEASKDAPAAARKLSPKGRPECIGAWIQRARAPTYRPAIASVEGFGSSFTAWWSALQPEWRRSADGSLLRGSGELDEIRVAGINGLLSVLAALFFWGAAPDRKQDGWLEAVNDVAWVLQQLAR